MSKLTQMRLKEVLHYDPDSGVFTWTRTICNKAKKGDVAGNINKTRGYRHIKIDGKSYRASRLAWLYVEGYWPEHCIDHINRIRHDDRWTNLRHVSQRCNTRNCNISKWNKTGITGVNWDNAKQRFRAEIMIDGKSFFLGGFKSIRDAAVARWNAEVQHGFPNCNTTSTAYKYLKERGAVC